MENKAGLYIHIPFCKKKCGYCDFYSVGEDEELIKKYTSALIAELKFLFEKYANLVFDTIYLGGGTPGLMPLSALSQITDCIYKNAKIDGEEFTIELNPCSSENFSAYKSLGINRVSIGVQSLSEKVLKTAGRQHGKEDALSALERAASVFNNISADIMLGLPYQSEKDIGETLDAIYPFVNHISAYILKLADNSPMQKSANEGKITLPDDDSSADMYVYAYEHMKEAGYERYEISNFARENKISRHNMKYWTRQNYIGAGAAAHSFIDGIRSENPSDLWRYMSGENFGNGRAVSFIISEQEALFEEIMLRLRLKNGINIEKINNKYNIDFMDKYKREIKFLAPLTEIKDGRFFIKEDKFLLQGVAAREFLPI